MKSTHETLSELLSSALGKLKPADSLEKGDNEKQSANTANDNKRNGWLRNASLLRAEMHIRNHAECLDLTRWRNVSVSDLDASGFDEYEKRLIGDWFSNNISGRQCICLLQAKWLHEKSKNSNGENKRVLKNKNVPSKAALGIIGSMVDFPVQALDMEENYLYNTLFSKSPLAVVGETLKILTEKAVEQKPSTMLAEQINLAFKQFRVERISSHNSDRENEIDSDTNTDEDENQNEEITVNENEVNNSAAPSPKKNNTDKSDTTTTTTTSITNTNPDDEYRYIQVLMELIAQFVKDDESLSSSLHRRAQALIDDDLNFDDDVEGEGLGTTGINNEWQTEVTATQVECELDTSLDQVVAEAEVLSHVELNELNAPLKNYITRLSNLKGVLDKTLKEVEESESYLALGVSKESSDNEIKRAYHKLAVRTHPDKPGGDTAKFQVLQTAYQEICKKRAIEQEALDALEKAEAENNADGKSDKLHAQSLINQMSREVRAAKMASEQIGAIAQLSIHLGKTCDRIWESQMYPHTVSLLEQILFDPEGESKLDLLAIAVEPTEVISEALQSLSATAVRLADCGPRYSLAAAKDQSYSKATEAAMEAGLTLVRCITSLLQVQRQVTECVEKFNESRDSVDYDQAVHDVIAQMLTTVVRCCSTTMAGVAERALSATLIAAELVHSANNVLVSADSAALEQARRDAEVRERMKDYENDPSRMNTDFAGMKGECAEGEKNEDNKDGENEGEKEKNNDNKGESGDDDPNALGIADLQSKVKALQVQIRVQNISILQTLNAEARHLQHKLHHRLQNVNSIDTTESTSTSRTPVLALLADFVDHSCENVRDACSSGILINLQDWTDLLADKLGWMKESNTARLALLPDIRSRAIWTGALVDPDAVRTIIDIELRRRLRGCLKACPAECYWAVRPKKNTSYSSTTSAKSSGKGYVVQEKARITVDQFCSEVLESIEARLKHVEIEEDDVSDNNRRKDQNTGMEMDKDATNMNACD